MPLNILLRQKKENKNKNLLFFGNKCIKKYLANYLNSYVAVATKIVTSQLSGPKIGLIFDFTKVVRWPGLGD